MKNISLKHRLIISIALLGLVALLSNILSVINIRNVNASAASIADNYMEGKDRLAEICQSSMDIHKMALSHIVATDYNTMILLVQQINEEVVDYMSQSVLKEFQTFVETGSQYKKDAAYIRQTMDDFHEQTQCLTHSMSGIADSIGTITKAIDDTASGIAGMASNTRNLAADMEDITRRMGVNQDVVAELEKETVVFDNL